MKGHPVQRAMFLEFIDDRTTHYLDRQYMLGRSLLVAPVFVSASEPSEYYLPAGLWTSLFDPTRVVAGPVWVKEKVALDDIPVWVRPGSVLLLGPAGVARPDYDLHRGVEVQIYELGAGESAEVDVPSGRGSELAGAVRVRRDGDEVTVKIVRGAGTVEIASVVLFSGSVSVARVVGGRQEGGKVIPDEGAHEVVLHLHPA